MRNFMGYRLRYLEQQKSGVFRYRRDFPSDVGAILDRKTFKQSLKTKDELVASLLTLLWLLCSTRTDLRVLEAALGIRQPFAICVLGWKSLNGTKANPNLEFPVH